MLPTNAHQGMRQGQDVPRPPHIQPHLTLNIPTPLGMTRMHFTEKEWLLQDRLYSALVTRTNAGGWMGVGGYLEKFGTIDPLKNYGWGSNIWPGIRNLLPEYPYSGKLRGQFLGWFVIPVPFSKVNAAAPRQGDHTLTPGYFPAIFSYDQSHPTAPLDMACLNILIERSGPWSVHRSRAVFVMALEDKQ